MDTLDITPLYAINKIKPLIETNRFEECSECIDCLNNTIIRSVLDEISISYLHIKVPQSLCVLDSIYKKLYGASSNVDNFPIQQLRTDELLKNLVILFSRPLNSNKKDKNCNMYYPYCRNMLKIITTVEPQFLQMVIQKKKHLEHSLKYLGKHGMVRSSSLKTRYKMISLHDALKIEFERLISIYKTAIQKIEEFNLLVKIPSGRNVSSGPAPSEASHQRLLQLNREDIQDRLIENKTIFNVIETAQINQTIHKLITILEKRIEYDKFVLFQESELKKLYGCDRNTCITVTMRQYIQGYTTLIQLVHEAGDVGNTIIDSNSSDDDDDDVYTSYGSVNDRFRSVSVNALDQYSGEDNPTRNERGKYGRISSPLFTGRLLSYGNRKYNSRDNSPSNSSLSIDTDKQRKSSTSSDGPPEPKPRIKGAGYKAEDMTSYVRMTESPQTTFDEMISLKKQVEILQKELKVSREEIKKLEEREKSLRERLSGQIQKQFAVSNQRFENLSLGSKRPTELIRRYGNLYTDGRLDALDALDDLKDLEELSTLKTKILFSIIVLSFRSAEELLDNLKRKLRETLNIPSNIPSHDTLSLNILLHIDKYLQETFDRCDLVSCVKSICEQICETLFDYPCLRECEGLTQFVEECMNIALGLLVQSPAYVISYNDQVFNRDNHVRFHTSDPDTDHVQSFLWPCLLEGEGGICVSKGFVVT